MRDIRQSRQWEQRSRGEKAQPRTCSEEGERVSYLAEVGQGSSEHEASEAGDQRPPVQEFGFYQRAMGHPRQVLRTATWSDLCFRRALWLLMWRRDWGEGGRTGRRGDQRRS